MELRQSPLWQEISAIAFEQSGLPPIYSWKAEFLAGTKKVVPMKVVSISVTRDFRTAYGDQIVLEVFIAAGDFVYDIYANRQNLLVTLSREGRLRGADASTLTPDIGSQQFRATLLDEHTSSMTVEGLRNAAHSKQALNTIDILTVKFQICDLALERIRLHSVGGIFNDTTPSEVLNYVLTSVSTQLGLDDSNAIQGVEMVDSPNTDKYKHIVIPHGTKFPDVPMFLHHKVGGLYPTGMGLYLFRQSWYVYPLYDLTRFESTLKTLTLINLPTNQLPNVEWTYRRTANQIIALVTGNVKHFDLSESKLLNEGNGVRYLDARQVVDGFADTDQGENKAVVTRAANNNEFVTDERLSGLNNVVTSGVRITANKFSELSKLAKRTGAEIQCIWENSDMGAIYPGMPVKYLYIKEDRVHELFGIVLGADHYVQTHGKGITESRHRTDTVLHLFVTRDQSSK
jgi:hypothetical protein